MTRKGIRFNFLIVDRRMFGYGRIWVWFKLKIYLVNFCLFLYIFYQNHLFPFPLYSDNFLFLHEFYAEALFFYSIIPFFHYTSYRIYSICCLSFLSLSVVNSWNQAILCKALRKIIDQWFFDHVFSWKFVNIQIWIFMFFQFIFIQYSSCCFACLRACLFISLFIYFFLKRSSPLSTKIFRI